MKSLQLEHFSGYLKIPVFPISSSRGLTKHNLKELLCEELTSMFLCLGRLEDQREIGDTDGQQWTLLLGHHTSET